MVCAIQREAGSAITSREIAAAIIAQMEWNARDSTLLAIIVEKVGDVRKRLTRARDSL